MSAFLTRLVMENASGLDDGKWILTAPLIYQSDVAGTTFIVPVGFETDLASVPRIPLAYWLAGGTSNEASVVHDFLYTTHPVTRAIADAVLKEASAVTGVPAWRRWMMWVGVRIGGGGKHWNSDSVSPCATSRGPGEQPDARGGGPAADEAPGVLRDK